MAGSRTRKQYTADSGEIYSVQVDESNAEATVQGEGDPLFNELTQNRPGLPSGFKQRYVLAFLEANPLVRRKFKIGAPATINGAIAVGAKIQAVAYPTSADDAGGAETFVVTAYRGEKQRVEPAVSGNSQDTGLTDGDPN